MDHREAIAGVRDLARFVGDPQIDDTLLRVVREVHVAAPSTFWQGEL